MKKKRGKFIVIEGIDGSGKSVQSGILQKQLSERGYSLSAPTDLKNRQITFLESNFLELGYKVEMDDYPRYESSEWGKLVGRMLTGEFGKLKKISPYLSVLPYMIDEYWGCQRIKKWLGEGRYVVSNRYFTSCVHQVAKCGSGERDEYREWMWRIGWNEMKILKPDLVIVLFVEPEVCRNNIINKQSRKYTKGKSMDQAEADFQHQMEAAKEYRWMIEKYPELWVGIECCVDGKMMSQEKISELVWTEIDKRG